MTADNHHSRRTFLRTTTAAGVGATAVGTAGSASAAPPQRPAGPLRVHVVLFDGVEEMDFAAPYYVLGIADMHSPHGVSVRYVTADGSRAVTASQGTRVRLTHGWAPDEADVLVVPGGGFAGTDRPGVGREIRRGVLPRTLARARRPGLTLASVCTGAILLGAAGLLRGRPCTTHHGAFEALESYGGVLTRARVVDDGDLVTSGGITSGLELGLWLVRRAFGPDAALDVERMLEYEARGTVWTAGEPSRSGGR
ncbi:DJ-1/PfpI family protein [Streptomyces synnematoformans]|uniref:DJ-1/PfpI family protein n=1 Tax=Streptomyces synnematoformans TaxID=415721 RepID=A0ABN2YKQ9_9ACTN